MYFNQAVRLCVKFLPVLFLQMRISCRIVIFFHPGINKARIHVEKSKVKQGIVDLFKDWYGLDSSWVRRMKKIFYFFYNAPKLLQIFKWFLLRLPWCSLCEWAYVREKEKYKVLLRDRSHSGLLTCFVSCYKRGQSGGWARSNKKWNEVFYGERKWSLKGSALMSSCSISARYWFVSENQKETSVRSTLLAV